MEEQEKKQAEEKDLAKQISDNVVKEIKKDLPKWGFGRTYRIIKDVISVIIVVALVVVGFNIYNKVTSGFKQLEPVEGHDLTLENNGIFGYKAVDFEDAIVGAATKKALLIVDEQELSVVSKITDTGLFNLGIFSKNQAVTYVGIAQYTVNLENITKDDIQVDNDSHTVTVKVPHAELHNVLPDPNKTVFGVTDKGLLAFGDISMTTEQNKKVEVEATEKLGARALEADCMKKADEYALYVLRDFFETSINSVTNSFKVKVEFDS